MSQKKEAFFDSNNEATLQRALYNDICRRIGGDLNEKQASRLMKTVKHYMGEVYRVKGSSQSIQQMNKEVLVTVLPDYMMYMERTARSSGRSVMSDIEAGAGEATAVRGYLDDAPAAARPREQLDVGAAFTQLQNSRQGQNKVKAPDMPDFRIKLNDEGPVPVDVFERIKQDREAEAARAAAASASTAAASAGTSAGMASFVAAGDSFARERRRAQEAADEAYAEQERRALEARAAAAQATQGQLPMPPDMRSLYLGDRQTLDRTLNRAGNVPIGMEIRPNSAAGNPTVALGSGDRAAGAGRQQMIITREPESMEYKETELNLFVYSGDRDWISNSSETRYDFSVSFDPGNGVKGLRLSPTSTAKFRNIVRVELVKAIMPGESIDSFVTRTYSGSAFTYSAPYNFNILSFPYIQVRIPELDNNVYGTNLGLNAAFGVLQYDANWIYDTNNAATRGYFAMIPKFLKCQKTYTPTPLATLQKLSFRFERPDGDVLSTVPDTLDITQIYSSKQITVTAAFPYGYDSSVENGTGSAYYMIKTSTYFSGDTVSKGDRIVIKNLTWSAAPSGAAIQQIQEFLTFMQDDGGMLVVDTGYGTAPAGGGAPVAANITIGENTQGYCNYIIVRGKFADPTTGATATVALGNQADGSIPGSLSSNTLTSFMNTNALATGRLLNQSHQVQVALRVITREMDPTSVLRPDNL